ncbi:outer membrane beta-barrel protein [Pedobacter heparinus]|uniref:outer membrane beta-barrel protein n=1 Tax=Pedobacter heparinus TaxID=984 RepID=UPI00292E603A|nr:outer membrane beta-barrel protein [Pedobacter heparinus]
MAKCETSILLFLLILFGTTQINAQKKTTKPTPPPLSVREISGIVKDTTDLQVIGATVSLTSAKDTLKTSTNNDGYFIFKNVKLATYTIVVQSIGYVKTPPMRFKQNDMLPRIVMDPIVLKEERNTLNTVVINGEPSITYKTDTIEYKASDYVVRENSTVDELLKKMEGMEVGTDGTLVHNGESVLKAKLNGKEYLGGDVANAIKNLPAEIVDKIQIVDDYGDEAARTGVKEGDPQKILNITTRTDKSVGNLLRLNTAGGNNKRYDAGIFGTRINGNQQIGVRTGYKNIVNGVAGGGGGGGSGGTTNDGNASFSIRDKIGKKIEVNINYGFNANDINALNNSFTHSFTNFRDPDTQKDTLIATNTTRGSVSDNNSKNHSFKADIDFELDSNNFINFSPSVNYSSSLSLRSDSSYQTGFRHQRQISSNKSTNTRPQLGAAISYTHRFSNKRRRLSLHANLNSNNNDAEQQREANIVYFLNEDETERRDSLVNRIIARKNLQNTYRGSLTYVEPLSLNTQLELNAQLNYNGYSNDATTRNVTPDGYGQVIDSLSNIFDYSFTQARISMNFRYGMVNTSKFRFSAGLTGIPSLLSGTKVSLGTTTERKSFNLIPIARMEYLWSRQHKISLNYSGSANEPSFDQIQPVRDVSNPQNPRIGNPDLKASFTHTIRSEYNNYLADIKMNYSLNMNASFTQNSVVNNTIDVLDPNVVVGPNQKAVYISETRYINVNGSYRLAGNYSISKQLSNRKYNLSFSGSANYNHRISMSNGGQNINTVKTFIERFGPRINPTDWFEINPYASHNYTKSENTLLKNQNEINTLAFNVDGKIYFLNSWLFGYSASKNYVSGIAANLTSNPFVVNAYLEKELFNRRGRITLHAFDILNQNNFVSRDYNDNGGYTDTRSNALSQYFMLRLSMRLQKWSGAKGRKGQPIRRRGDGSFM